MVEIEPWGIYEATVRIRRGPEWVVRDEADAQAVEGQRARFQALWQFSAEDRKQYEGEWAMRIPREWEHGTRLSWIASGDLVDVVEIEPGLAP